MPKLTINYACSHGLQSWGQAPGSHFVRPQEPVPKTVPTRLPLRSNFAGEIKTNDKRQTKPMKVKKHYEQDHVMLYVEDEGMSTCITLDSEQQMRRLGECLIDLRSQRACPSVRPSLSQNKIGITVPL